MNPGPPGDVASNSGAPQTSGSSADEPSRQGTAVGKVVERKCGICKSYKRNVQSKHCNRCGVLYHRGCMDDMSSTEFIALGPYWLCGDCKSLTGQRGEQ